MRYTEEIKWHGYREDYESQLPELDVSVTVRIGDERITRPLSTSALDPMALVRRMVADERGVDIGEVKQVTWGVVTKGGGAA